jgi:hypothetical protein
MKQVIANNAYLVRSAVTMVEIHDCISCDKIINTEDDAFHIIDDITYECWSCYCHPVGR